MTIWLRITGDDGAQSWTHCRLSLVSILLSSILEKKGTKIWLVPEIWSLEGCQSLLGLVQNSRSYLTFFKLIATKCRHTGLDSSCAKGYQDQADHGQSSEERGGLRAGPQRREPPPCSPYKDRVQRLSPEGLPQCTGTQAEHWMKMTPRAIKSLSLYNHLSPMKLKIAWNLNKDLYVDFWVALSFLIKGRLHEKIR